jgi:hypothetical protein
MSINKEKEIENLTEVGKYLTSMGITHTLDEIENGSVSFPALITSIRYEEFEFDVIIYNKNDWINIKCLVLNSEGQPQNLLYEMYEQCLEANFNMNEVTFSVSNKDVYLEADLLVGVALEDFQEELKSIAAGIKFFVDLVKESNNEVNGTKGTERNWGSRFQN